MRRRLSRHLINLCLASVLLSTLIMIMPAAVVSDQFDQPDQLQLIKSLLDDLSNDISNKTKYPVEAFEHKNEGSVEGRRGALRNKIDAVINKIDAGAFGGALNKMTDDIKEKIEEWIDDQWETKHELIKKVETIIELIGNILHKDWKPPVAMFTESAETVYTGETISFNASESYDPDGDIISYFWNFGDGTNATDVLLVEHAYADDGVYNVILTVTDNDELTATFSSIKTVLNRPPEASFTESTTTVLTGEDIHFDASGSEDPDGRIIGYIWNFGDGTTAADVRVSHAYDDNGTYTVTLTVIDDDGATASTSAVETILNRPPVALFTVEEDGVVYFNASESYDPDGEIAGYFWDFGDGTNVTNVTANHTYAEGGNYTVILTVTDDDGASSSRDTAITVEGPAGLPLAWLAAIILAIIALTVTVIYLLYRRRRKKTATATATASTSVITLYVPQNYWSATS